MFANILKKGDPKNPPYIDNDTEDKPQSGTEACCVGEDGKLTDTALLNELLDNDRDPTPEVKALLRTAAIKDGLTNDEIAYLYGC